jgi:serpin B
MRFYRGIRFALAATLLLRSADLTLNAAEQSEIRRVVDANTAFAFDLYGQLKTNTGNVFFSPFSISTCLAMTYAGAGGDTAKQMAQVLHFPTNTGLLHVSMGEIQRQLANAQGQNGNELTVANGLWAQSTHPFLAAFLSVAKMNYAAELRQVDFTTAADAAAVEMGQWITAKTKGRIQAMFAPGSVGVDTRLVLVNLIYFKGRWTHTFAKSDTAQAPFHISPGNDVEVSLMHHLDMVKYAESDVFQTVELPYTGGALSTVIILPRNSGALAQVEAWLSPQFFSRWLSQMRPAKVEMFLPAFTLEVSLGLSSHLSKMGMTDAFQFPKADFSGMDGARDLFVWGILHKAWVQVNEEGTEAAAATSATVNVKGAGPPPPPVFRADHPFIFLIRDTRSGSLLFLGRLSQPTGPGT